MTDLGQRTDTVDEACQTGVLTAPGLAAGSSWRRPRTWHGAAGLAAGVMIAAWVHQAWFSESARVSLGMNQLIAAAGTNRFSEARLSEPFQWGRPPSPTRGDQDQDDVLATLVASLDLQRLAESRRTGATLRGAGVSLLALGKVEDAVAALEDAVELTSEDARIHLDLSAALLERLRVGGDAVDGARALDHAQIALHLEPGNTIGPFNKALALEAIGSRELAAMAWHEYLKTDATGPWADEARGHLDALQRESTRKTPSPQDVASLPDDELAALAADKPAWLDRVVATVVLPAWAKTNGLEDARTAVRIGRALRTADHGTPLLELAELAEQSAGWPQQRQRCLADALESLARWRSVFEIGDRRSGVELARLAGVALDCARVDALALVLPAAWAAITSGQHQAGFDIALKALPQVNQRKYWSYGAQLGEAMGAVALDSTKLSDAGDIRRRALALAVKGGETETAGRLEKLLGEAADEQGDQLAAWQHFRSALLTLDDASSSFHRYTVISTVTIASSHAGFHGAALSLADALMLAASGTGRPGHMVMALMQRGRARAALGDFDRAVSDLSEAKRRVAVMGAGTAKQAWEAEIGWIQGLVMGPTHPREGVEGLTTSIDYFETVGRRFRLAELLLHRGRLHRRLGAAAAAADDWQRGMELLEDQRPAIREEQLRISRAGAVWGLFSELVDLRSDDPRVALEVAERAKARELLDHLRRDQQQSALALPDLQACLPESTQALVYSALPQRLLTWTVTRTSVHMTSQPVTERELSRLVGRQSRELQDDGRESAGRPLGRLLIPNGLQLDASQSLVIVPDGPLHRVSFAALPVAGGERRLVETTMLIVSPSLTTFCVSSKRIPNVRLSSTVLIGVDQALPAANLPALPGVRQEIESLARIYRHAAVLSGPQATAASILSALPERGLIHFAGHAEVDELLPSRSRLFAAPGDGQTALRSEDIAAVRFSPGTLVILAACETAAGKVFKGEGTLSLSRPFLAGGAAAVLGSLWNIRDLDARRVIERVHQRLAGGERIDRALAQVQRELILAHAPLSVWSSYVVAGSLSSTNH